MALITSASAPTLELRKLIRSTQSGFASGERAVSGTVQLRMNNVTTDGILDWSSHIRVPTTTKQIQSYSLRAGDVLFNSTNSPELVGKTTVFPGFKEPVVFSNHFLRLRVDDERLDSRYLAYWITVQWQRRVFERLATRWVNQASVRREDLLNLRIPLPPLPEQQHIAGIISRADRLRRLRRYALELSDGYLQSVFLEMFWTNALGAWPSTDIGSVAKPGKGTIRTGPFGSQLLHSEFVEQGIAVLGIDNAVQNRFVWAKPRFITAEKYKKLKRYTVYPGDVLITIMGTIGRCAVVPDGIPTAINTKHLCCITCDRAKCEPDFLKWAFLVHPQVRAQLEDAERGAIMPGLNMGIISGLEFPLPPLNRQRQFVDAVRNTERLREQQREALRQAEHLFQTLLHGAFRGEYTWEGLKVRS